jgi:hypothetical protein
VGLPSGWFSATGEGLVLFDTFETIGYIGLYIPADTEHAPWRSNDAPLRTGFAGGVGFGLSPDVGDGIDPVPDGFDATVEVFHWHWLQFQYEAWIVTNLPINSGTCFFWKLSPDLTLYYEFHGP